MSDKQKKTRVFVIFLVILVLAIIAIGFYLTFLIIKDGQRGKQSSFHYEEASVVSYYEKPYQKIV